MILPRLVPRSNYLVLRPIAIVSLVPMGIMCASLACGGAAEPGAPDSVESPLDTSDSLLCQPGTPKECINGDPSFEALVCNSSGDGYQVVACTDGAGTALPCENGSCTECRPGAVGCLDEDWVKRCGPDGRWLPDRSCSETTIGFVCEIGTCVSLCELNKKLNTYFGCEYWPVDLDNALVEAGGGGFHDAAGAPFAVAIANPSERFAARISVWKRDGSVESEVIVDHFGQPLDLSPVPPGSLRVLRLPRRDVDGTVLGRLAYRLQASIPITAYQFNPLDNTSPVYSNDASLLLPTEVLGKFHLVMTREQTFSGLRSFVTIVGTEEQTHVGVTVTAPTLSMNGIPPLNPGETYEAVIGRYDVLSIQTNKPGSDLTGTVVVSNRNVAVFGGSEAANAPNTASCGASGYCEWDRKTPCNGVLDCVAAGFNTCCADHLEQQLYPVKAWGTEYAASKSEPRGQAKDIWRILAADNSTLVVTKPKQANIPVLNRGEWFEFESSENFVIEANRPVLVGQFLAAQDAPGPNGAPGANNSGDAGIGDPAFMLAVPTAQYRTDYVVLAPDQFEYDYLNITAPPGAEVFLDGEPMPASSFEPISSAYRVARVRVEDGEHRIRASAPVGVIVYGFDRYVSYGYPGGLDLRDLGFIPEVGPGR